MKEAVVYYFSGSGNSYYIAKEIAGKINAEIYPVRLLENPDKIKIDCTTVGFVFPVYDFKPPAYVIECIKNIMIKDNTFLFCVANYGLSAGKTIEFFKKSIESDNINLSAGYTVAMPHNGICSSLVAEKHRQKVLNTSEAKIKEISDKINRKEQNFKYKHFLPADVFKAGIIRMFPGLLKFIFILITKGIDVLAFRVEDSCNGCGICSCVCPVNNIKIVENVPVWSDRCAGCFGCLHWCPEKAITPGGYEMNIKHYHHPGVKAKELSL